ncbi:MAG TPA: ABC transporter ATP-binding protein [Micromonosporaceae bacterium]|nr:ABC transporter ATP-binding protein [Micromonosporaceae bacterium]
MRIGQAGAAAADEGSQGEREQPAQRAPGPAPTGRAVSALLEVSGVTRCFGELRAVDDVTLSVSEGARHALIGPNGAGKSTLFNVVAGALRPTAGRVRLAGRDVTRLPEWRRARLGLARTFQHSSVLLHCTAVENVLVSVQREAGVAARMLPAPRRRRALVDQCLELLDTVGLAGREHLRAAALSHGERRQLELAVALGARPRLLLLDEPAAGMSPAETARLTELVRGLPREVTVLLIEHDLDVVFGLADRVTVLHLGRHLATGTPQQVRADPAVREAYLGASDAAELF